MLLPLVVGIPLVPAGVRDAEALPQRLLGDRAYDGDGRRAILRWLGIEPQLAERGAEHGSSLGKERYVVEQTLAALHHNRRLKVRYEKWSDMHVAFLTLACIKVCWYRLCPKTQ
jgi:IS5 family transposase